MAYTLEFVPVKFNKSLEEIRVSFPLINESIYENKAEDTASLIERLAELDIEEMEKFALNLKSSDLDLPLVAFRTNMDAGMTDKLDSLLELRFRKKLFLLNWLILQNNFRNEKLITSMHNLSAIMSEKYPNDHAVSIFAKIKKWDDDCIDKVLALFLKEKSTVKEFFDKYQFLEKSKFSYEFYVSYFKNATKEMILENWDTFFLTADSYVVKESATVINVYLGEFDVLEFDDDLMKIIVEKYAPVDEEEEFWKYLNVEARIKYFQWTNLKTMQRHFIKEQKKYNFWSNYIGKMLKVETYDDIGLIFIYFDNCVVVDMGETEQNAFLYYKESFEIEYERFDSLEGEKKEWRIFPDNVIDVKDSLIEGKRSDIYKFSYEFVGRLYLKEILKIETSKKKQKQKGK